MNVRHGRPIVLLLLALAFARCADPPTAAALSPVKPICTLAGLVSTLAGKVCSAASHPGQLVGAGKQLLGGHVGGALESLAGDGAAPVAKGVAAAAGIAAIGAWVTEGARFALRETAAAIAATTQPQLQSTWFSSAYWRIAAISALLTLPFLFAAAIQAILHSDLSLLARAALGYLPLALLGVSIAAPVTTLLLAASDELSGIVSSASGGESSSFLAHAGAIAGGVSLVGRSPFLVFFVGLLTAAATITLWIELLVRSAAVYVIVLLLPLFFAALVWPARRVWAVRAVELLVALVLSKFAIVAVLALGGAALAHAATLSVTSMLAGTTLVLLAAFSPWALLRMLPLHELAGGAAGGLRSEARRLAPPVERAAGVDDAVRDTGRERPSRQDANEPSAARAALARLAATPGGAGRSAGGGGEVAHDEDQDAGDGPTDGGGGAAQSATGAAQSAASVGPAPAPSPDPADPTPVGADSPPGADPSPPGEQATMVDRAPQSPAAERLAGMPATWQAPDNSWATLRLGGPEGWPPPPPLDLGSDATADEVHDPRPPRQDPDEGRS